MATNRPAVRRLILCGICFKPDCPLSKWVTEDGDLIDIIDDLHSLFIECQHSEIEAQEALKLKPVEKQERIDEAIAQAQEETGNEVQVMNLDELLGSEIKGIEKTENDRIQIDKGSFIEDILGKYAEHLPAPQNEQQNQKEKGH